MTVLVLLAACGGKPGAVDVGDSGAPAPTTPAGSSAPTSTGTAPGTTPGATPTGTTTPGGTTPAGTPWTDTSDTGLPEPRAALADVVREAPGAGGGAFRDPELAINGVRGGGDGAGSLDVFSIGYAAGDDRLVLGWAGRRLDDGDGVDLVVFENPFLTGDDSAFMDPAVVEVSANGVDFVAFPAAYLAPDPSVYSTDPGHWVGFAGVTPVRRHVDDDPIDPFDPAAGGDAFDLADLPPDDPVTAAIRAEGVLAVRITAATNHVDPETGLPYPADIVSNGPDIDGVWGRVVRPD